MALESIAMAAGHIFRERDGGGGEGWGWGVGPRGGCGGRGGYERAGHLAAETRAVQDEKRAASWTDPVGMEQQIVSARMQCVRARTYVDVQQLEYPAADRGALKVVRRQQEQHPCMQREMAQRTRALLTWRLLLGTY